MVRVAGHFAEMESQIGQSGTGMTLKNTLLNLQVDFSENVSLKNTFGRRLQTSCWFEKFSVIR